MKHFPDRNIFLYYLTSALDGLRFLVPVWLIWYTRFISMSTVGIIECIGILIGMILEVPTGAFADIFGRRTSIIIGKIGISIGAFAVAFAISSPSLILGILFWNIFATFVNGADTALIYDHLKSTNEESKFAKVSANAATYMRLGIIIGSFTGGYIFHLWAPLPYFIFGVFNAIEALLWFFVTEPKIDSQQFNFSTYRKTISDGFRGITHSAHIRLISLISVTVISFAFLFREYLNYSYAIDLKLNAEAQSWLFGVSGILKTIAVVYIGYLISKVSKGKIIFIFLFLYSLIMLPANWSGLWGGIIVILLSEFISATAPIISATYMNQELSSDVRATAMSFINMFSSLVYAIGLVVGMFFIDRFKSPIVFTSFGIILLVLSTIFLYQYQKEKVLK